MFELRGIHPELFVLLFGDLKLNGNSHSERVIGSLDLHDMSNYKLFWVSSCLG